ncbi:MAG: aminotransferase class I/II-fold pyridoxal phosphate-dependent enzyme [Spirochaetia bacterium]|nr:aminotransferase class I/II-fold pyridoxal phosphate-dependent enzyme [Spirochaetia bacterium]
MAIPSLLHKCYDFDLAEKSRNDGSYPFFRPIEGFSGSHVIINGKRLFMAGSNNYLGLAVDERVKAAAAEAAMKYGSSCSGSRFMNGTLDLHEQLEERIAAFTGKEAALCFTTGYQANLGAISALLGRGDHIFIDKYSHASIFDGIFLASGMLKQVNMHRYTHNDMQELEQKLAALPLEANKIIATDGVFSMEGCIANLPRLRELADRYNAVLYLDEAHAYGVIGEHGKGTEEYFGYRALADIIMCTFSKSFGSIGGFIAGSYKVIDYVKHASRSLIFSASMPPANIAAASAALDIIETEPQIIHRLQRIGSKMIDGFKTIGFNIGTTQTPIVPLIIGNDEKTFMFWHMLFEHDIYVNPVISPAVPPNGALLRTSYMAIHEDEDLDHVLNVTESVARTLQILPTS